VCNEQARMGGVQSCLVILRVLRDMRQRDTTWKPVTDWVSQLGKCAFIIHSL